MEANKDTTVYPQSQNGFAASSHAIIWKEKGKLAEVRRLYYVSNNTAEWDVPGTRHEAQKAGGDLYAMGSSIGYYCYIIMKRTGKKETMSPIGGMGYRHNVTLNIGTIDEETLSAHCVYNYFD